MSMQAVKTPCPECPFIRTVKPGALGGTPPGAYIGQARGPFTLPCHVHCDFDDPEWKSKAQDTPQCAGAAVFRTHIGVADRMPPAIPVLPADGQVFADEAEFLAHHTGMPLDEAKAAMTPEVLDALLHDQLWRAATGRKP